MKKNLDVWPGDIMLVGSLILTYCFFTILHILLDTLW